VIVIVEYVHNTPWGVYIVGVWFMGYMHTNTRATMSALLESVFGGGDASSSLGDIVTPETVAESLILVYGIKAVQAVAQSVLDKWGSGVWDVLASKPDAALLRHPMSPVVPWMPHWNEKSPFVPWMPSWNEISPVRPWRPSWNERSLVTPWVPSWDSVDPHQLLDNPVQGSTSMLDSFLDMFSFTWPFASSDAAPYFTSVTPWTRGGAITDTIEATLNVGIAEVNRQVALVNAYETDQEYRRSSESGFTMAMRAQLPPSFSRFNHFLLNGLRAANSEKDVKMLVRAYGHTTTAWTSGISYVLVEAVTVTLPSMMAWVMTSIASRATGMPVTFSWATEVPGIVTRTTNRIQEMRNISTVDVAVTAVALSIMGEYVDSGTMWVFRDVLSATDDFNTLLLAPRVEENILLDVCNEIVRLRNNYTATYGSWDAPGAAEARQKIEQLRGKVEERDVRMAWQMLKNAQVISRNASGLTPVSAFAAPARLAIGNGNITDEVAAPHHEPLKDWYANVQVLETPGISRIVDPIMTGAHTVKNATVDAFYTGMDFTAFCNNAFTQLKTDIVREGAMETIKAFGSFVATVLRGTVVYTARLIVGSGPGVILTYTTTLALAAAQMIWSGLCCCRKGRREDRIQAGRERAANANAEAAELNLAEMKTKKKKKTDAQIWATMDARDMAEGVDSIARLSVGLEKMSLASTPSAYSIAEMSVNDTIADVVKPDIQRIPVKGRAKKAVEKQFRLGDFPLKPFAQPRETPIVDVKLVCAAARALDTRTPPTDYYTTHIRGTPIDASLKRSLRPSDVNGGMQWLSLLYATSSTI